MTEKDPLAAPAHAPVVNAMASAIAPTWQPRRHGARAHPKAFATCIRLLPHAMVVDQYVMVKTRASVPEQEPSAQVPPWPETIEPVIE